jgi:hypothetical protein
MEVRRLDVAPLAAFGCNVLLAFALATLGATGRIRGILSWSASPGLAVLVCVALSLLVSSWQGRWNRWGVAASGLIAAAVLTQTVVPPLSGAETWCGLVLAVAAAACSVRSSAHSRAVSIATWILSLYVQAVHECNLLSHQEWM